MTHLDVKWNSRKQKWQVIKHSENAGSYVQANRMRKNAAIKKAKGIATQMMRNESYTYSKEVHIYGRDGKMQRIEKVNKR